MEQTIIKKLKKLPKSPGIYIYRNAEKRIIYVGKAVNLKNRVSSYFNKTEKDPKTIELVKNIANLEWIEVGSEFEALIFEADLIKRYKPKYNIRFKDDKNYVYLKITKEDYPRISVVHQITDHEAEYIGPFVDSSAVKSILKLARKIFPYCSCGRQSGEVCLYYHIGLCQGHDQKYISKTEYAKNISGIKKLFNGRIDNLKKQFTKEMKTASKEKSFEKAAFFRDKVIYLEKIKKSHFISERDLYSDSALSQLKTELNLDKIPEKIECFDISNIMGTAKTASMVVFLNGVSAPKLYRRFQVRTVKGADDFASMAEILKRRFSLSEKSKKDISFNSLPDLVILDGGKGQLSAVLKNIKIPESVKVVSLAKKYETIYKLNQKSQFESRNLTENSEAFYLIQRIRDEAHRFAVTYHRKIKGKELFENSLDAISGVGPKTKKKLLKEFGSIKNIKEADIQKIVMMVGEKLADKIKEGL